MIGLLAAVHESGSGPSRHAVPKWMMVAFGAKRTSYVARPGRIYKFTGINGEKA